MTIQNNQIAAHEATDTNSPAPVRCVRISEAAERCGVTTDTILRWEKLGKIPRRRLFGAGFAWLSSEFDEWMCSRPPAPLKKTPLSRH